MFNNFCLRVLMSVSGWHGGDYVGQLRNDIRTKLQFLSFDHYFGRGEPIIKRYKACLNISS